MKIYNNDKTGAKTIFRRFFMTLFILTAIAVLFIAVQYAGDKTRVVLEGKGFQTITLREIKNYCIIFFGMLK